MTPIRLRYTKNGKIRFASHRDVARIWERSLRAAGVPMVYSEGYSPRPRIAFGLALPTGSESDGEYIDIQLDDGRPSVPVAELPRVLTETLPPGIEVTGLAVLEPKTPSLQAAVTSCVWEITVTETIDEINQWVQRVLAAPTIVVTRERKRKAVTDDLRPLIRSLDVVPAAPGTNGGHRIRAELGTQPRSLRPSELLSALEPALHERHVRRLKQWIEQDGARLEPLQAGAAPAPHTTRCAS